MQSFASLPAQDRWALAFHAGRFAYPEALIKQGRIFGRRIPPGARIPNFRLWSQVTPAELEARVRRGEGERR